MAAVTGPEPLDVSMVVVTHDSVADIGRCLDSLQVNPPKAAHEVIVVDNASTDGTASVVTDYAGVRFLCAPRRRGFSANCNAGAKAAAGRILVFLNADTRVTAGAIDTLVSFLDKHESVAVAGPRLVYPDGTVQPSARRFPDVLTTVLRRSPLRMIFPHSDRERRHLMLDAQLPRPHTVDWLLGASIAIRTSLFWELGAMDEGYRLYCEDIDLCWRAWQAGFVVAMVPDAVVEHDLGELTRRRFLTRATIWHISSMGRFVLRHGIGHSPARPLEEL